MSATEPRRSLRRLEFQVYRAADATRDTIQIRTGVTADGGGVIGWSSYFRFSPFLGDIPGYSIVAQRQTYRVKMTKAGWTRVLKYRPFNVESWSEVYSHAYTPAKWTVRSITSWKTEDFRRERTEDRTEGTDYGLDLSELWRHVAGACERNDPVGLVDWLAEQDGPLARFVTQPGWLPATFAELRSKAAALRPKQDSSELHEGHWTVLRAVERANNVGMGFDPKCIAGREIRACGRLLDELNFYGLVYWATAGVEGQDGYCLTKLGEKFLKEKYG